MGRTGFKRIWLTVADTYKNRRPEVDKAANALAEAVAQAESFTGARARFDAGALAELEDSLVRMYDLDRKSTRLNSSHSQISYAVFCLKKKKKKKKRK